MDKRLLDILCCPVSKTPLRPLTNGELAKLNAQISATKVNTVTGLEVSAVIEEALITTDGKVIYRVEDGIPVMLPEEAIATLPLRALPPET